MNKKIIIIGLVLAISVFAFFAINVSEFDMRDDERVQVSASFYPLAFFAERVGGEKANVYNLTPAGAEPHEYELTPMDIVRIENSDILLLNGGGLEPWSRGIDSEKTLVIKVAEGLMTLEAVDDGHGHDDEHGHEEEHGHDEHGHDDEHEHEEEHGHEEHGHGHDDEMDPHVWLDPALASLMVDRILEGFLEVDFENAEYYQANAEILKNELNDLDRDFSTALANCEQRVVVTSHAAFGYLARAYDLDQLPIAGLSPEHEPSVRELIEITEFARENDVKYIFFETLVSPRLAETIATEIGAETLTLNTLEGLTKSELSMGKDYFTEMRSNLANLQKALQCQN